MANTVKAKRGDLVAYPDQIRYTYVGAKSKAHDRWNLAIVSSTTRDGTVKTITPLYTWDDKKGWHKTAIDSVSHGDWMVAPAARFDMEALTNKFAFSYFQSEAGLKAGIKPFLKSA